jgi:hypothetical protein
VKVEPDGSSMTDTVLVAAAPYDSVDAGVDHYETIKALDYAIKDSDEFDSAVIAIG